MGEGAPRLRFQPPCRSKKPDLFCRNLFASSVLACYSHTHLVGVSAPSLHCPSCADREAHSSSEDPMHTDHQDGFMVYLRLDRSQEHAPEVFERLPAECAAYQEARRIQREYRRAD